jgi:hypothetical protein
LRLRLFTVVILWLVIGVPAATAQEPVRVLPKQLDKSISRSFQEAPVPPADAVKSEAAEYVDQRGRRVFAELLRLPQDAKAYEKLSLAAAAAKAQITSVYGTAGFQTDTEIVFFKGPHFVRLRNVKGDTEILASMARGISEGLDKGENDIPALIKHLPNAEEAQKNAVFLHSFRDLSNLGLQQGVLTAIDSQGNADAALATYGQSKVLILEFNTPQLAKDNDERIIARVHELWKLGQSAPTAYRRVGNYSVMVFDAPDQQSANQLIDQVKYEQVVQWLGENPNILKQAEQHYVNTTLGVLVAVLKASGYALLACLGIGGLAGALLFTRRRAQQSEAAFSDAGGMLRLNLDELTPQTNPARLLRDRN